MRTVRTRRRAVFRTSAFIATAALAVGAAPAAFADAPQETVTQLMTGADGKLSVLLSTGVKPLWVRITVRASAAADAPTLLTTDDTEPTTYQTSTTTAPVRLPAGTAYGDYPVDVDFRLPGGTVQHWTAADHGTAGLLDYRLHAAVKDAKFDRTTTDWDHRTAVLTGSVESYDPATGQDEPAPAGTHVRVSWVANTGNVSGDYNAPATTDASGAFRLPITPGGALWSGQAVVEDPAPDTTPAASTGLPDVGAVKTTYRISAVPNHVQAHKGDKVTVSGSVQRETGSGWKPFSGATVVTASHEPDFNGQVTGQLAITGSGTNGTFTNTLTASATLTHYTFLRPSVYLDYAVDWDTLYVPTPGKITLPAYSLDRYGLVTSTGRFYGGGSDCSGQPVYLQVSTNGKTGWRNLTHTTTGYVNGSYCSYAVSAYGDWDGYYRVYHPESREVLALSSPVHRLKRTRTQIGFAMSSVHPSGGTKLTGSGVVSQLTSAGWKHYAKAHVVLVFKPKGDTQWYWVVKGYTNSAGRYTLRADGTARDYGDGTWGTYVDADSTHYYSESKDVYVDAR